MRFIQQLIWATAGTIALAGLSEFGAIQNPSPFSKAAQAGSIRYVPPGRRGAPVRSQGGGSRNCGLTLSPVTLLAPLDHVGLTTQAHPKLLWYSANDSMLPIQITMVEPGMSEPLWTSEVKNSNAGLNQIQLPDSVPDLVVGRRYRWSITRLCSVRRGNDSVVAKGWIERVAVLPTQINAGLTASLEDRVGAYAESGLWYDAIAKAAESNLSLTQAGENTALSPLVMTLLEQGGIKTILQQEQKRSKTTGITRYDPGSDSSKTSKRN